MVLVLGLLGCLAARAPQPTESAVPVATIVTLVNPEAGRAITPSNTVLETLQSNFAARGWQIKPMKPTSDFDQLGTSSRRAEWLVEKAGDDLVVLIETEARQRAQLGGRFQWVVDASITVAVEGGEPIIREARFPTTLPHIHQDELDALEAVAPRIAAQAALQIERQSK